MINKKINFDDVILFLLFNLIFIKKVTFIPIWNYIRYFIIIVIFIYIIFKYRLNYLKKYRNFNAVFFVFCIIGLITTFFNNKLIEKNIVYSGIMYFLSLFELLFIVEIFVENEQEIKIVRNLSFYSIVYFSLACISIFAPNYIIRYKDYLVGSKFDVTYLGIISIEFTYLYYNIKKKNNKIIIYIMIIFNLIISLYVRCYTATIGILTFFIVDCIIKFTKRKPSNSFMIFLIALSFVNIFVYEKIINYSPIFNLITVIEKNDTLLSRAWIYNSTLDTLSGKLLFGYGYGTSYEVLSKFGGIPDTQNALLELIFYYGIIGFIPALILFNMTFSIKMDRKYLTLYCYFIAFIIMGAIEITYDLTFFSIIIMAYIFAKKNQYKGINKYES